MKKTRWRVVPRYPNYEVSDRGQVRRRRPGRGTRVGRLRAQVKNSSGYLHVSMTKAGWEAVHVLVCEAFHGPAPSPRHEVAHRDGKQTRNHAGNLRWATFKENCRDKARHGRLKGERNPFAVLTARRVRAIRRRARLGETQASLGRRYEVAASAIWKILNGTNWGHIR